MNATLGLIRTWHRAILLFFGAIVLTVSAWVGWIWPAVFLALDCSKIVAIYLGLDEPICQTDGPKRTIIVLIGLVIATGIVLVLLAWMRREMQKPWFTLQSHWVEHVFVLTFGVPVAALYMIVPNPPSFVGLGFLTLYACVLLLMWRLGELRFAQPVTMPNRFAPGAAGIDGDGLRFTHAAKAFFEGIQTKAEGVSVVTIVGDSGTGKSSFVRMGIESLGKTNADQFLYTYISLSETNESEDFGRLFEHRWRETLAERYPMPIPSSRATALLEEITRAPNVPWWLQPILNALPSLVEFLIPEPLRAAYPREFGYLKIQEKNWFVVIDEIERAPIDEVLRVTEVLERFKHLESRGNSIPVPITFVIPYCRSTLFERLDKKDNHSWNEDLVRLYFSDGKTRGSNFDLPSPSRETRERWIQSLLASSFPDVQTYQDPEVVTFKARSDYLVKLGTKSAGEWVETDKAERLLLSFLADLRPRVGVQIINDARRRRDVHPYALDMPLQVRAADILSLVALEHVYPKEFKQLQTIITRKVDEHESLQWFPRRSRKNAERTLLDEFDTKPTTECQILLNISARFLWERNEERDTQEFESTCDPRMMRRYLSMATDHASAGLLDDQLNAARYLTHVATGEGPSFPHLTDLLSYAEFVWRREERLPGAHAAKRWTLNELTKRIESEVLPIAVQREIETHVGFLALQLIEGKDDEGGKENLRAAWNVLTRVLMSPNFHVAMKMVLLRSFVHRHDADIHRRLNRAFGVLQMDNPGAVTEIVSHVLNEIDAYLNRAAGGDVDVFAECGEYGYFLLYQSWNGSPNDQRLDLIRRAMHAKVGEHPDVLEYLWRNYQDVLENQDPSQHGIIWRDEIASQQAYMRTDDLIDLTLALKSVPDSITERARRWDAARRSATAAFNEFVQSTELPKRTDTLFSYLLRMGILVPTLQKLTPQHLIRAWHTKSQYS